MSFFKRNVKSTPTQALIVETLPPNSPLPQTPQTPQSQQNYSSRNSSQDFMTPAKSSIKPPAPRSPSMGPLKPTPATPTGKHVAPFDRFAKAAASRGHRLQLEMKSALVIQKFMKRWIARRKFLRQRACAITAQRVWRGYKARKWLQQNIDALKEQRRRVTAVRVIKRYWMAHRARQMLDLLRKKEMKEIEERIRLVAGLETKILLMQDQLSDPAMPPVEKKQLQVRLKAKQQKYAELCQIEERRLRRKLQWMAEAREAHQRAKVHRERRVVAIVRIQSYARAFLARNRFLKEKKAATKIQKVYRGHVERQEHSEDLEVLKQKKRERKAALMVQRVWRGHRARERIEVMRKELFMEMAQKLAMMRDIEQRLEATRTLLDSKRLSDARKKEAMERYQKSREYFEKMKAATQEQIAERMYLMELAASSAKKRKDKQLAERRAAFLLTAVARLWIHRRRKRKERLLAEQKRGAKAKQLQLEQQKKTSPRGSTANSARPSSRVKSAREGGEQKKSEGSLTSSAGPADVKSAGTAPALVVVPPQAVDQPTTTATKPGDSQGDQQTLASVADQPQLSAPSATTPPQPQPPVAAKDQTLDHPSKGTVQPQSETSPPQDAAPTSTPKPAATEQVKDELKLAPSQPTPPPQTVDQPKVEEATTLSVPSASTPEPTKAALSDSRIPDSKLVPSIDTKTPAPPTAPLISSKSETVQTGSTNTQPQPPVVEEPKVVKPPTPACDAQPAANKSAEPPKQDAPHSLSENLTKAAPSQIVGEAPKIGVSSESQQVNNTVKPTSSEAIDSAKPTATQPLPAPEKTLNGSALAPKTQEIPVVQATPPSPPATLELKAPTTAPATSEKPFAELEKSKAPAPLSTPAVPTVVTPAATEIQKLAPQAQPKEAAKVPQSQPQTEPPKSIAPTPIAEANKHVDPTSASKPAETSPAVQKQPPEEGQSKPQELATGETKPPQQLPSPDDAKKDFSQPKAMMASPNAAAPTPVRPPSAKGPIQTVPPPPKQTISDVPPFAQAEPIPVDGQPQRSARKPADHNGQSESEMDHVSPKDVRPDLDFEDALPLTLHLKSLPIRSESPTKDAFKVMEMRRWKLRMDAHRRAMEKAALDAVVLTDADRRRMDKQRELDEESQRAQSPAEGLLARLRRLSYDYFYQGDDADEMDQEMVSMGNQASTKPTATSEDYLMMDIALSMAELQSPKISRVPRASSKMSTKSEPRLHLSRSPSPWKRRDDHVDPMGALVASIEVAREKLNTINKDLQSQKRECILGPLQRDPASPAKPMTPEPPRRPAPLDLRPPRAKSSLELRTAQDPFDRSPTAWHSESTDFSPSKDIILGIKNLRSPVGVLPEVRTPRSSRSTPISGVDPLPVSKR